MVRLSLIKTSETVPSELAMGLLYVSEKLVVVGTLMIKEMAPKAVERSVAAVRN